MNDFELVVSLTKKEYIRATFIMLTKVKIIRLIPIVLMIPVLLTIVTDVMSDSVNWVTFLLPLIPIIIVLILIYRVAQKSYKMNKDQLDNKRFIFSENRLRIEVGEVSSEFPKSYIHRLTENKEFFFIWTNKNSAQVIPKRQLSANEKTSIKEFCLE